MSTIDGIIGFEDRPSSTRLLHYCIWELYYCKAVQLVFSVLLADGTRTMFADLKANTERWETERQQLSAKKANPPGKFPKNLDIVKLTLSYHLVAHGYAASITHQSRQSYGPIEAGPDSFPSYYPSVPAASLSPNGYSTYHSTSFNTAPNYSSAAPILRSSVSFVPQNCDPFYGEASPVDRYGFATNYASGNDELHYGQRPAFTQSDSSGSSES